VRSTNPLAGLVHREIDLTDDEERWYRPSLKPAKSVKNDNRTSGEGKNFVEVEVARSDWFGCMLVRCLLALSSFTVPSASCFY
jgi:hypothetical protein